MSTMTEYQENERVRKERNDGRMVGAAEGNGIEWLD